MALNIQTNQTLKRFTQDFQKYDDVLHCKANNTEGFMIVNFNFKAQVYYCGAHFEAELTGTASIVLENYGADRDGNRGMKMRIIDDIQVESVVLEGDETVGFHSLPNTERLYNLIEEEVLKNL